MPDLIKGRYRASLAQGNADVAAACDLRTACFATPEPDGDALDADCLHMLVRDLQSETLVCCFRLLPLESGTDLTSSYSAQYYDLSALTAYPGRLVEMGRFCVHPDWYDPDILRVAWGALTAFVDDHAIDMLIGCSSFPGTEPDPYLDAFALLKARHLAPKRWEPRIKAPDVFRFAAQIDRKPDDVRGLQHMPSLLRSYLMMGGWVSDHAVVDRHMNTLHVFTGLDVAAIPSTRKRLLRAIAS